MGNSILPGKSQEVKKERALAAKALADEAARKEAASQTSAINRGTVEGLRRGDTVYENIYSKKNLDKETAKRSGDIIDIISQRREAAKGLSSAENAAMVDRAQKAGAADSLGALRQTRGMLSGAGVRGGAAGGALGSVAAQGAAKMADQRRQFVMDNVVAKKAGLDAFEQTVLGQEGVEREALAMRGKSAFAFADLGQQAATLPFQFQANQRAADAAARAAGGGPSVICTELHRQGIMPDDIFAADTFYGAMCIDPQTLRGYQFLATPVARMMSRSKLLTAVISPLAMAWANNMAHFVGLPHVKPNRLGAVIGLLGEALCYRIGRYVPKRQELSRARV